MDAYQSLMLDYMSQLIDEVKKSNEIKEAIAEGIDTINDYAETILFTLKEISSNLIYS